MQKSFCVRIWLSLALLSAALPFNGRIYGATIATPNGDPDVDGSGIVDYSDLEAVAHNWLWRGQAAENAADLDLDGTVDFNDFGVLAGQWLSKKHSVAIFVDSDTYSSLQTEIERLRADIANDLGVRVFVLADNWSNIESIKEILIERNAQDVLVGAILIGEIPTAYF